MKGKVDAAHLREAADCAGRAVGGRFKRLQKLSAGHIDDGNRVAERQNGIDVVLGDVARLDGSADAAAVGNGDHVVFIDGQTVLVLQDLPDHCIGDEVAVVGLAVAVAVGRLGAVELDLADGKLDVVFRLHAVNDLLSGGGNGFILRHRVGHGNELVALDLLGGIVNDDHADVGECSTGGLDRLILVALGHHGVGVTVDDHVDPLGVVPKVVRSIGLGLIVNAEMAQADHNISVRKSVDLLLGNRPKVVDGKGQTLDERRVGFGLGFRRLKTEEADLHAGLGGVGVVRIEDGRAVSIKHISADDLELRLGHIVHELLITIVKLMVADGDDIVAGSVHHCDGIGALGDTDIGRALAVVAGVNEDDLGTPGLIVSLERGNAGIAGDRAVDIVRMQDNGLPCVGLFHRSRADRSVLCRQRGDAQGEHHGESEQNR